MQADSLLYPSEGWFSAVYLNLRTLSERGALPDRNSDIYTIFNAAMIDPLPDREYGIMLLMAKRLSNREIAEKLFLSEGSVKQYINQIYSKLHIEGDVRSKRKRLPSLLSQKAGPLVNVFFLASIVQ